MTNTATEALYQTTSCCRRSRRRGTERAACWATGSTAEFARGRRLLAPDQVFISQASPNSGLNQKWNQWLGFSCPISVQ